MEEKLNRDKEELIPFQEDVNVRLFFPGAQRRELLDEVKKAIDDGVAVVSIVGGEGTGKTMICRMLEKEMANGYICLYLNDNLESFDEVFSILASEIDLEQIVPSDSVEETVSAIVQSLSEKDKHLVIIFDQAEKMYLAMLERLRKLLDRVNTEKNMLQLIFAGRKVLLENLDQLEICDIEDTHETHFYLDVFDNSETYAYLNHCARLRSRTKGKAIFTPEAAKRIYAVARGNLKTTNALAAQAIESADDAGSFMVTPKNIDIENAGFEGHGVSFWSGLRRRSLRVISGGVLLLLCCGIALYFLDRNDRKRSSVTDQSVKTAEMQDDLAEVERTIPSYQQNSPLLAKNVNSEENQVDLAEQDSLMIIRPEKQAGVAISKSPQQSTVGVIEDKLTNQKQIVEQKSNQTNEAATVTGLEEQVSGQNGSTTSRALQPAASQSQQTTSLQSQEIEEKDSQDISKPLVAETIISGENKKQPLTANQNSSPVLTEPKKSTPRQSVSITAPKQPFTIAQVILPEGSSNPAAAGQAVSKPAASGSGAELFALRKAAGKVLFSQKSGDIQTIQVIALSGDNALKNLQEKFSQQQYREIASSLYVLEGAKDNKLLVYYGAYPDKESATKAMAELPQFLKKNQPYIISTREAASKATLQ